MSILRNSKLLYACGLLMTRRWSETGSNSRSHRRLMCSQLRNFGPRVSSRKSLRSTVEDIGFAVKRGDQPVDTFVFEDSAKFGATRRNLADRAVKVDI